MKLNKMRLDPARGKDYAEMVFWGDVHYGSSYCDVRKATAMLDYCLKNNVYVFNIRSLKFHILKERK